MGGKSIDLFHILIAIVAAAQHEAMLFAAIGLAIGGLDDLAIDMVYLVRILWRRLTVYTRHAPMTIATLPAPERPGRLAIFVPAWAEAGVIGPMLTHALRQWGDGDYRIFVGTYPNDPATVAQVATIAEHAPHVRLVVTAHPGPTTKADCLNALWRAMLRDEAASGTRYKAIALHDAEDVVHADELRLLDRMMDRFDLVQLPVLPLHSQNSRWIAAHYCDEFAEAHGKYLVVREALGAAVPSAGVGCAFARPALAALAKDQGGDPFDPHSLTEDYEIGLRIAERGGSSIFVRMQDATGVPVCTRGHFPETLEAAIRQKTRWTIGIALAGWDRMGWSGGWAERWMRLRDRRAALAALILFAAYVASLSYALLWLIEALGGPPRPLIQPLLATLLSVNAALMAWRIGMRAAFVRLAYGWRQALLSVPRTLIANYIAILAARRAISAYLHLLRGAPLIWDKTQHRFPEQQADMVP